MTFSLGDTLPDLTLSDAAGTPTRLAATNGRKRVIYFYPKDDTPGCTREGQDFTRLHAEFAAADTDVIGISKDSAASHQRFAEKYGFTFTLLADPDQQACRAFDVIHEKVNYGRKYLGVVRSTFLFDAHGVLQREWRGVKVAGHAEAVLEAACAL
ncbi:MAG: peroxiredoxin [Nevskiaceae bacterium]|nr:MAG: peroxiredoxin [Nevskiaceae bacterium]TBR71473.1 MAG: peroxiredoxin [Nevskiaceae bacterium]